MIQWNCIQWNCIQRSCVQNKTSPNIGILLEGGLIPRLFNNPFASCFSRNFGL